MKLNCLQSGSVILLCLKPCSICRKGTGKGHKRAGDVGQWLCEEALSRGGKQLSEGHVRGPLPCFLHFRNDFLIFLVAYECGRTK